MDIILVRTSDGKAHANVEHQIVRHSPDGFEWGYHGSGPADLALNILLHVSHQALAEKHYQDFKREFIAPLPEHGGTIKLKSIQDWLMAKIQEERNAAQKAQA